MNAGVIYINPQMMPVDTQNDRPAWELVTPRELALERKVAELERELYAYRVLGNEDTLRHTTLREPEIMQTTVHAPEIRLRRFGEFSAERDPNRLSWHMIGRAGYGARTLSYSYYISDLGSAHHPTYILTDLHRRLIHELANHI